jgi:hypothetical protein
MLTWRRRSLADWSWLGARLLLAANWAFNAFPGKYRPGWYQHEFSARVGSFARGNPWPPIQAVLTDVVLAHPALFAGLSAAGETAAAVLLLVPLTTRLGGAVSAAVGISYALASGWINVGYAVHPGSFALLGILFLALGASLPVAPGPRLRFGFAVLGAAGLALAWPMAFRWIGLLPTLPWTAAAVALLAHGIRLRHLPLQGTPQRPPAG